MLLKNKFQHAFACPILRPQNEQKEYFADFDELGPLAGRYHLVELPEGASRCNISIELSSVGSTTPPAKAIVHAISNGQPVRRQKQINLQGLHGQFSGGLQVPLAWLDGTVDLILVIMANVSYGANQAFIDDYRLTLRF